MVKLKTILVAIDFSPCSLIALRQAGRLATENGAKLHVIHAVNSKDIYQIAAAVPFSRKEFDEQLVENIKAQLRGAVDDVIGETEVEYHAVIGHPLDAVVKAIKDIDADLLVIGAFGDGGPGRGASAFSTKCARRSPINVLLVDESWPDTMKTVMACIDFSEYSNMVADEAARYADFTGAQLKLVHAHSNPFDVFHWGFSPVDITSEYEQYKASLQSQLEKIGSRIASEHNGLQVETELVFGVDYTKAMVSRAKRVEADLAVIGAKGRTALSYIMLGSTTEKMLRQTDTSVLTVRQS